MQAARMGEAEHRVVCDLCGAHSSPPRGRRCSTCAVGTLRYRSELDLLRRERAQARRAERSAISDR